MGNDPFSIVVVDRKCFYKRLSFCPRGRCTSLQADTPWVDTPLSRHPPPQADTPCPDGHRSGRHASYWNALLFGNCNCMFQPFNLNISILSLSKIQNCTNPNSHYDKYGSIVANFLLKSYDWRHISGLWQNNRTRLLNYRVEHRKRSLTSTGLL